MELRQLRAFLMLCEELHFSRAALRLHVAQSAISYAIKSIEAELGTPLFSRSKRKVTLTGAGEHFRAQVSPAVQSLDRAAEATRRIGRGQAGRLVLRFTLLSALTSVPRVLARFREACPEVEIDVGPGGSVQQLEAIRAGHCDIGFMAYRNDIEALATETVQRSPVVALLPVTHRLAKRRKLRLRDLASDRFVFLKQDTEPDTRARFRKQCLAAGFEPQIALEIDQLELLLAMVAAGMGVSCAPDLVRSLRFPGVAMVPLTPLLRGGISAVWDPKVPSPVRERFLALLRAERSTEDSEVAQR
jgi:DNA-binding transcriptional LysR family regulator